MQVFIRWMVRRDMAAVLRISNASFRQPWTEEDFIRELRQRNVIGMVAEVGDTIVGYMMYELRKHSLEVLNFAVHPDSRRHGVGTQMIDKLIGKLSAQRRSRVCFVLPDDSLAGHLFLRARGFKAVSIARGFWDDGQDGYRFVHRVKSEEAVEDAIGGGLLL